MNHLEEREAVKFVLNGRSFDTATSSQVAIDRGVKERNSYGVIDDDYPSADQIRYEHVLFRTAKGAFFLHDHTTVKYKNGKPVVKDEANEFTPEEAMEWISRSGAAIIDSTGLPLPGEA